MKVSCFNCKNGFYRLLIHILLCLMSIGFCVSCQNVNTSDITTLFYLQQINQSTKKYAVRILSTASVLIDGIYYSDCELMIEGGTYLYVYTNPLHEYKRAVYVDSNLTIFDSWNQ